MYMSQEAVTERDTIIFGEYDPKKYSCGQIRRFSGLCLENTEKLVTKGYLAMDEAQNDSPTTAEFMKFALKHPNTVWVFGGYAVSPNRDDVRVTIDEFESIGIGDVDDMVDFVNEFRYADELEVDVNGGLRCWYD